MTNRAIETVLVQREYDRNWELVGKFKDYANSYSCKDESGRFVTLTPMKWITIAVYPFIMEEQ